jgi:lysophospholipase L1-like esterase
MKIIKTILYQVFILTLSVFIIEGLLRFINSDMKNYDIEMWRYAKELKTSDPVLGHKHRTNKSSILQGVEIKLNSEGMRNEEFRITNKKILFLGSSISLGWGIKQNKSYPQIIQTKLDLDSLSYKVLNGSVGNYNTLRYVNNFLSNQVYINPNVIVVNYFINDAETLPIGNPNWLIKNSQLFATLKMTFKKLSSKSGFDLKSYYRNLYEDENPSFIEMKKSLNKLSEYSIKTNTPILLTVIPDIHFLVDYPFEKIHEKMKTLSTELGFEYHDLLPSIKEIPFEELQIIPGDSHPNEFGHQRISESLYPKIKDIISN